MKYDVLGTEVEATTFEAAVDRLLDTVRRHDRARVHFATVHSIVEATKDARLAATFATADVVFPDGMPLVWLGRRRGLVAERVCGPDIVAALMDRGRAIALTHYLYGGAEGVAEAMAAHLRRTYPGVQIVGWAAPPFRALNHDETAQAISDINAKAASVVWVGLGSPKQEFWAAEHQDRLAAALILPVGAAFNFYSGRVRRAPRWMQRTGLEWFFRLVSEPRRLWRRYAVTNSRFFLLLSKSAFHRLGSRVDPS
jgi:N-acetylglucosaminyldiphosphoundecaprenol N-acetyl-beta-D-mannosaminyltransferase